MFRYYNISCFSHDEPLPNVLIEQAWIFMNLQKVCKQWAFSLDLPFLSISCICLFLQNLAPTKSKSPCFFGVKKNNTPQKTLSFSCFYQALGISPKLRMVIWKPNTMRLGGRWLNIPIMIPKLWRLMPRDIYIYIHLIISKKKIYIYTLYVLTWYISFYIYIHRPTWHLHSLTIHA